MGIEPITRGLQIDVAPLEHETPELRGGILLSPVRRLSPIEILPRIVVRYMGSSFDGTWWTAGESNPDYLRAKQGCSHYH